MPTYGRIAELSLNYIMYFVEYCAKSCVLEMNFLVNRRLLLTKKIISRYNKKKLQKEIAIYR
jgi:hypothetical protein